MMMVVVVCWIVEVTMAVGGDNCVYVVVEVIVVVVYMVMVVMQVWL